MLVRYVRSKLRNNFVLSPDLTDRRRLHPLAKYKMMGPIRHGPSQDGRFKIAQIQRRVENHEIHR